MRLSTMGSKLVALCIIAACSGESDTNKNNDDPDNKNDSGDTTDKAKPDAKVCQGSLSFLLLSTKAGYGEYTGNEWKPVVAITKEDDRWREGAYSGPSGEEPSAECRKYRELFSSSNGNPSDDPKYIRNSFELVHYFPGLRYPATAEEMPSGTEAIDLASESVLKIKFEKKQKNTDGSYDYTEVAEQTWKLDELSCNRSFSVQPLWASELSTPPFCRQNNGKTECLYYRLNLMPEKCNFKILNQSFKTPSGEEFKANIEGYFKHEVNYNYSDIKQGYRLTISNVEFL